MDKPLPLEILKELEQELKLLRYGAPRPPYEWDNVFIDISRLRNLLAQEEPPREEKVYA